MIKLYQRYLAAHFIPPFVLSVVFFVTFLLTFQLFQVMKIVIGKSVDFMVVMTLIGHIAISFLPMAIPISVLFAAIYTMNKLSEDSEIVAMRSFGATKFSLYAPFLGVTTLIALCLFILGSAIVPHSRTQFRNTLIILSSQGMLSDVRSERFYMEIPGVTLFAEEVEEGDFFRDVFIVFSSGRSQQEQVISAESGVLIKKYDEQAQWSFPLLRMHLRNGTITTTYSDRDDAEVVHFEEYDFPIVSEAFSPSTIARDSMMPNAHLRQVISERSERLRELQQLQAERELRPREQRDVKNYQESLNNGLIELYGRFNAPLQCLSFSLLGFSLGVKQGRGRSRNTGALSIVVVIGYYALHFLAVALTQEGLLTPFVSVFFPTIMAFLIAWYFFKKVDWLS